MGKGQGFKLYVIGLLKSAILLGKDMAVVWCWSQECLGANLGNMILIYSSFSHVWCLVCRCTFTGQGNLERSYRDLASCFYLRAAYYQPIYSQQISAAFFKFLNPKCHMQPVPLAAP